MSRRFLKTSATYFAGTVLSKVIGLVLLPLYTAAVQPDDFGQFDFWTNLVSFLAPITFFQVWDAAYRLHFKEADGSREVASTGLVLMVVGAAAYSITVVPLMFYLGAPNAGITACYGLALVLQYFLGYLARSELRNTLFVASGLVNTAATAFTSVWLIELGWEARGLVWGLVLGNLSQCVTLFIALRPWRAMSISAVNRGMALGLLAFSAPLCLTSASYWLLTGWTRLVVLSELGPSDAGLLAVGFRFGVIVTAMTSVLVYAWNELLFTAKDDAVQASGGRITLSAGLLGTACVILATHLAFDLLVDSDYSAGRNLAPLVILGTGFNSIATLLASIFMARNDTRPLFWSTAGAAGVNVIVGGLLVGPTGVRGAATVLAVAFAAMLVWRIVTLKRRYQVVLADRVALIASLPLAGALATTLTGASLPAVAGSTILLLGSSIQVARALRR